MMSKDYNLNAQRQGSADVANVSAGPASDGARRLEAEITRLKKENAELRAARIALETNVKSRFSEIAQLTRMLHRANTAAKPITATANNSAAKDVDELSREAHLALQLLAQRSARNAAALLAVRTTSGFAQGVTGLFQRRQRKGAAFATLAAKANLVMMSGLFDAEWYREQYPDVREGTMDPIEHYLQHGALEGRNPGPLFDAAAYLKENTDVAESNLNPLLHYITNGCREGRAIKIVKD
jgi:hypothetical protein